jgi:hypothetical protein
MENGIYHVVLSAQGNSVEGVMVVSGNAVNGGGHGYIRQGVLSVAEAALFGDITIKKWDGQAPSALGLFKEASIRATGHWDPETRSFHFEGRAGGHHVIRIQATGRYLAPPAFNRSEDLQRMEAPRC